MNSTIINETSPKTFCAKILIIRFICFKAIAMSLVLSNVAVLVFLPAQVQAQTVPIVITADQPNVWTLEQAHYLLAQMHRRNLDLKAQGLGALDANAINGVKLDLLKTLLEVGIEYNGADRFNNSQAKSNQIFNSTRRQELTKRNDNLQNQSLQLTQDIALLNIELKKADSQEEKDRITSEIEQKTVVQAKVDKQIEQNNSELTTLNKTENKISETSSSSSFDGSKMSGILDKSFGEAAKKIIENADTPPKLNASLQLDNYLQLQYEIISKQLTLLRDEVGPGERVVFLELPQSINASYDRADKKWAQSWWKILGYTKIICQDTAGTKIECPAEPRGLNKRPLSTSDTYQSILTQTPRETYSQYWFEQSEFIDSQALVNQLSQAKAANSLPEYLYDRFPESTRTLLDDYNSATAIEKSKMFGKVIYSVTNGLNSVISGRLLNQLKPGLFGVAGLAAFNPTNPTSDQTRRLNRKLIEQALGISIVIPATDSIRKITQFRNIDAQTNVLNSFDENGNLRVAGGNPIDVVSNISNRQIRTIELIPRQSSLNVNDIKLRNRSGALNIVASFLFGFGANLNYQRQHEQYSQFVQQELYSSAFGKGSREFGWTFTPMPGTDRLLSGVRTTYAIVVVPQEATSIVVDSGGCYFKRSDRQPQNFSETTLRRQNNSGCSDHRAFVLPIPGGGNESNSNDFYISGLSYQPVSKEKRVTVSIYGENFSSQIGVMVNGVPLKPSLGIAQPFILDDSEAAKTVNTNSSNEKIKGNFERIDAQQIVATFEVPDLEGTPTITLVAPGIAIDVNNLDNLYINKKRYTSLSDSAYMFGNKPSAPNPLKIESVEVFPHPTVANRVNALVYGDGFNQCQNLIMNGAIIATPPMPATPFPQKLITIPNQPVNPTDEFLKFTLNCNSGADIIKFPLAVRNPFFTPSHIIRPPVYNPTYLRIDKVTIISYEDSILVVQLEGSGFTENLNPDGVGRTLVVQSPTSAVLQIQNPQASQIVTFTDIPANLLVRKVIMRNPLPKTKVTETVTEPNNN